MNFYTIIFYYKVVFKYLPVMPKMFLVSKILLPYICTYIKIVECAQVYKLSPKKMVLDVLVQSRKTVSQQLPGL